MGKKMMHIGLEPGAVGRYVFLPGSPERTEKIAAYADTCQYSNCQCRCDQRASSDFRHRTNQGIEGRSYLNQRAKAN